MNYSLLDDITTEGDLSAKIFFKPTKAPFICFVFGGILLLVNHVIVRALGIFFIAMAVIVLKMVEDHEVMNVYSKGVLLFKADDTKYGYFLKYDDVKMWEISRENGHDTIVFTLLNDYRLMADTFQAEKAYSALDKFIHEKDKRVIQAQKNKELKFTDLFKKRWGRK